MFDIKWNILYHVYRWYNKLRYRKINMLMTRSFSNFKQYKNDFFASFFVYSLNGVSLDRCHNTRILMNIPTNSIHIHLTVVGNIGKTRNTTKTTCILIKLDDIKCINNNIYSYVPLQYEMAGCST